MPTAVENIPTADEKKVSASANNESGPENKNIIMPTAVAAIITCQPTDEKKRKGATASDNDERSGPPKKRYRYNCSADGCTNHARRGGVCIRHGAQEEYKRCNVEGCTNYEQKGGVCIRHGAKRKRCSFAGCPNQVVRRGVCYRHRAYSDGTPRANIQVQNNLGRDDGNTVSATQISHNGEGGTQPRGIGRKGKVAAEKQSNTLTSNNSVGEKVEIISDEEDGEKKKSSVARPKRKAGFDKQQSENATPHDTGDKESDESENEITGNKVTVEDRKSDESVQSLAGGESDLKGDKEQYTSDMMPWKRTRREVNLKDDKVQDTSDLASTQEGGRGGTSSDAMEDDNSWGGDVQNEYDCGDDNGDIYSERELQSHVVPEEITTAGANDDGKEHEIQRLTTELKQLNERVEELEGAQSRSKSEHDQQQLELKDLRDRLNMVSSKLEEKSEIAARLEASLRRKDVEMESSAAQLKEANEKIEALSAQLEEADKDGNEMIQRQINKYNSMRQEIRSLESKNLRLEQKNLRLEQHLHSSKNQRAELKIKLNMAVAKIEKYHAQSAATSTASSPKPKTRPSTRITTRINQARSKSTLLLLADKDLSLELDKDKEYHARFATSPTQHKKKQPATNSRRSDKSVVDSLTFI